MTSLHDRVSRYGTWLACCLSRGREAPLHAGDIEQLANDMGEHAYAGGTFVFRHGDSAARVDARVVEDCSVLSIETAALFELLQTRPLVARRWFVSLAERMAGLQDDSSTCSQPAWSLSSHRSCSAKPAPTTSCP